MSSDPVERARILLSVITPGNWSAESHGDTIALYAGRNDKRHGLRLMNLDDGDSNFEANVGLIVSAPDLIRALIDEIERLEKGNFL
jgi:hypothetical protein